MSLKLQKVREAMRAAGLDALLVTSELNQRYLLSYESTSGLVVVTGEGAYMLTDFRYYEEACAQADPAFTVAMPADRVGYVIEVLQGAGVRNVGFESDTLTVDAHELLCRQYSAFTLVAASKLVAALRMVKDESELAHIARAQAITDRAFTHILSVLRPEMTEREVALELEFFMRQNGAERAAFDIIAVSGTASALPHGKPRDLPLQAGFLTMDFGAVYEGYCADMTRTVVIGRADAEMRAVYRTVLAAQQAGLSILQAGIDGYTADKAARDIIDASPYPGSFGHSLGHGVGLYIHESPRLAASARDVLLEPGHVVTVEPGIYLPGRYGCRIEDMVLITEDGVKNFTQSSKELIELF
ncbi:MAG: Xaa-Pro peptidase family protein [Eubacteriales bacterium]